MKGLVVRTILAISAIALTVILFQNCAKNFTPSDDANGDANLGSAGNHTDPHITPVSMKFEPNTDIEFNVYAESLLPSTSYQWSYTFNSSASGCTEKNGNKATNYILNCAQAGALVVKVAALEGNTPVSIPVYSVSLATPPATAGEISLTVNFAIPAGTNATPWNSTTTVVETFIGQTLKMTNNDSVVHQMHTGGKPCPHGSPINPGATANCVISKAYNYKTDGNLYDHNLGTKSAFYMIAYDGSALYTQNCASCHGALASSERKGATVSQIKNALTAVPQMAAATNLLNLTQRQIEAISFALGAK